MSRSPLVIIDYRIDDEWQIPDRYTPFFPLLPGAYFEIVIFIEGQCIRVGGANFSVVIR